MFQCCFWVGFVCHPRHLESNAGHKKLESNSQQNAQSSLEKLGNDPKHTRKHPRIEENNPPVWSVLLGVLIRMLLDIVAVGSFSSANWKSKNKSRSDVQRRRAELVYWITEKAWLQCCGEESHLCNVNKLVCQPADTTLHTLGYHCCFKDAHWLFGRWGGGVGLGPIHQTSSFYVVLRCRQYSFNVLINMALSFALSPHS